MRLRKFYSLPKAALVVLGVWIRQGLCLPDAPSAQNFRRRSLQSVATLGNYLYIDGGEVAQYVDGVADGARRNNSTLSLALDIPWTPSNISINAIPKGSTPITKNPALWPDTSSGVMYAWGGEGFGSAPSSVHLWKFTPDGRGNGSWIANSEPSDDYHPATSGTAVVCGGRGFILGGCRTGWTEPAFSNGIALPGMLIYDMKSGSWDNVTAPAPYSPHKQGQAVCLPFGNESLVSFLGGARTDMAFKTELEYLSFDNITLYDPDRKEWFWQTARGDIPEPRKRFCAVGAAGTNGTYEIFIYGGMTQSKKVLSDVHVLSIPAFQWFLPSTDNTPRLDQRCAIAGNRHMISVGGHQQTDDPGPGDLKDANQDPWAQGLGVFDMSRLIWTNEYDPAAAVYDSATDIKSWYNINDLNSIPWSSEQVKSLFFNATSTKSASPQETKAPSKSTPVGPIVGGVVGGVALAALACGVYLWQRRRVKRRMPLELGTHSSGPHAHNGTSELNSENQLAMHPQEMPSQMEEPNAKYLSAVHRSELATANGYHELPQS